VFILFPLAKPQVFLGGLVLGSIMFLAAAILGADHTVSVDRKSRQIYKVLTLLSGLPVVILGILGLAELVVNGALRDAITTLVILIVFAFALMAVALDHHPRVRRALHRLGIATLKQTE